MRCAMTHVELDAHAPLPSIMPALKERPVAPVTARGRGAAVSGRGDQSARTKHTETFFEEEVAEISAAHQWLDLNENSPRHQDAHQHRKRYYKPSSSVFPARIPTWRQKDTPRVLLERLEECVRSGTIVPKSDGTYQVMPVVKRRRSCESTPDVGAYVPLENYCTQSDDERRYVSVDHLEAQQPSLFEQPAADALPRAQTDDVHVCTNVDDRTDTLEPPPRVSSDCDIRAGELESEHYINDISEKDHVATHEYEIEIEVEQDADETCVVDGLVDDVSSVHTSQFHEQPLYEDISDAEEEVCVETTTDIRIESDKNISQDTSFQSPTPSESQVVGEYECEATGDRVSAECDSPANVSSAPVGTEGREREGARSPPPVRPRRGSAPELSHTATHMRCKTKTERSASLPATSTMAHRTSSSSSSSSHNAKYHNKLTFSRMCDKTWRIKKGTEKLKVKHQRDPKSDLPRTSSDNMEQWRDSGAKHSHQVEENNGSDLHVEGATHDGARSRSLAQNVSCDSVDRTLTVDLRKLSLDERSCVVDKGARRCSATEKTVKAHVVAMIIGNLDSTCDSSGLAGDQCVEINITECEASDDQTENINYIIEAPEKIRVLAKSEENNSAPDFVINGVPFRTSEVGERTTEEDQVPIVLQYCDDNDLSASGLRCLSENKTYEVDSRMVSNSSADTRVCQPNEDRSLAGDSYSRLIEREQAHVAGVGKSVSQCDQQNASDSKTAGKPKLVKSNVLPHVRSADGEYSNANTVRRYVERLISVGEQSNADASRREKRSQSSVQESRRETTERSQSNELRRERHSLDELSKTRRDKPTEGDRSKSQDLRSARPSKYESKLQEWRRSRSKKGESKLHEALSGRSHKDKSKLQESRRGKPPKDEAKLQESRSGRSHKDEPKLQESRRGRPPKDEPKLPESRRGKPPKDEAKLQESRSGRSHKDEPKLQESRRGRPPKDVSKLQESRSVGSAESEQSKLQESRRGVPAESEQSKLQESRRGVPAESEQSTLQESRRGVPAESEQSTLQESRRGLPAESEQSTLQESRRGVPAESEQSTLQESRQGLPAESEQSTLQESRRGVPAESEQSTLQESRRGVPDESEQSTLQESRRGVPAESELQSGKLTVDEQKGTQLVSSRRGRRIKARPSSIRDESVCVTRPEGDHMPSNVEDCHRSIVLKVAEVMKNIRSIIDEENNTFKTDNEIRHCEKKTQIKSGKRNSSFECVEKELVTNAPTNKETKYATCKETEKVEAVKKRKASVTCAPEPKKSRKNRFSRRSFRHDSIQTFKVTPNSVPPPWRYKGRAVRSPDITSSASIMSKLASHAPREEDIADSDTRSPNDLIIDLNATAVGEVVPDLVPDKAPPTITEVAVAERKRTSTAGTNDQDVETGSTATTGRRTSVASLPDSAERRVSVASLPDTAAERRHSAVSLPDTTERPTSVVSSPVELLEHNGALVSPRALDEEANRKKRKKEDVPLLREVNARFATTQMQKNGRRLAQEIPGFNWLEEKIRNGGVPTVMPPRKPAAPSMDTTSLTHSDSTGSSECVRQPASRTTDTQDQPARGPVIVTVPGRPLPPVEDRQSILAQQLQLKRSREVELRMIEMHRGDLIALRRIQQEGHHAPQLPDNARQNAKNMPPSGHHGYSRPNLTLSNNPDSRLPPYSHSESSSPVHVQHFSNTNHGDNRMAGNRRPHPYYSPDTWDFSDHMATMARHTATCFDTGLAVRVPQYGPAPSENAGPNTGVNSSHTYNSNTHTRQQPWHTPRMAAPDHNSWMEREMVGGHPMRPTPHYAGYQYHPFNHTSGGRAMRPVTGHQHKPHLNGAPATASVYKQNSEEVGGQSSIAYNSSSTTASTTARVQVPHHIESSRLDVDGDSDNIILEDLDNMKLATRSRLEQVERHHIAATRDLIKIQESRIKDTATEQSIRARPAVPSATAAATGSNSYESSVSSKPHQAPKPWENVATLQSYLSKQSLPTKHTSPTVTDNLSPNYQRYHHVPETSRVQKHPVAGEQKLQSKQSPLVQQQQQDKREVEIINVHSRNETSHLQFGATQPRIQNEGRQRTNNLPLPVDTQSPNLHALRMNIPPETEIMIRNHADMQTLSPHELNRRHQTAVILEADRQYFVAGKRDTNMQSLAQNSQLQLLQRSQLPQGLELMLVQGQPTSRPSPTMQHRLDTSPQFTDPTNQRPLRQTQLSIEANYSDQSLEPTFRLQHQDAFTNHPIASSTLGGRSYRGSNVSEADFISDFRKYRHFEEMRAEAIQKYRFQEAQKQASLITEAAKLHHQEQVRRDNMNISLSAQRFKRHESYGSNVADTSRQSPPRHLHRVTQHRGITKQDTLQKESISSGVEHRQWSQEQGRDTYVQPARKLQRLDYQEMALTPAERYDNSQHVRGDTTMAPVDTGIMPYQQEIGQKFEREGTESSYYARLNPHHPQRGLIPNATKRTVHHAYNTNNSIPIDKGETRSFPDVAAEKVMGSKETERLLVEDIMRRGSVEISVAPQRQINQDNVRVNKLTSKESRCKQAAHPSDINNEHEGKMLRRVFDSEHQVTTMESRNLHDVCRRSSKLSPDNQRLSRDATERDTILMNLIPEARTNNVPPPVEHTTIPVLLEKNCSGPMEKRLDAQPYQASKISTELKGLDQATKEDSQDRTLKRAHQADITVPCVEGKKPIRTPDDSNKLKETQSWQQNTNTVEHVELLQESETPSNKKEHHQEPPNLQLKENEKCIVTHTISNQQPDHGGKTKINPQSSAPGQSSLESRRHIANPSLITTPNTSANARPSHTLTNHSPSNVDAPDELPMDLSMKKSKVSEESLTIMQNKIDHDAYKHTDVICIASRAMQMDGRDCEFKKGDAGCEQEPKEKVNNPEESEDQSRSTTVSVVSPEHITLMVDLTDTKSDEADGSCSIELGHIQGNSNSPKQESSMMVSKITNRLPIRPVEERILKRHSSKEHVSRYMPSDLGRRSETETHQVMENKTGNRVEDGLILTDISTSPIVTDDDNIMCPNEKESEVFEPKDDMVIEVRARFEKLATIKPIATNFQNTIEDHTEKVMNKLPTIEEAQDNGSISTTHTVLEQKHPTTVIHEGVDTQHGKIVKVSQSGSQLADTSKAIPPLQIPPSVKVSRSQLTDTSKAISPLQSPQSVEVSQSGSQLTGAHELSAVKISHREQVSEKLSPKRTKPMDSVNITSVNNSNKCTSNKDELKQVEVNTHKGAVNTSINTSVVQQNKFAENILGVHNTHKELVMSTREDISIHKGSINNTQNIDSISREIVISTKKRMLEVNEFTNNTLAVETISREVVTSTTREGPSQLNESTKNTVVVSDNISKKVVASTTKAIPLFIESTKNTPSMDNMCKQVVTSARESMPQLHAATNNTRAVEQNPKEVVENTGEVKVVLQLEVSRTNTLDIAKSYEDVVASAKKGTPQLHAGTKNTLDIDKNHKEVIESTREEKCILQLQESRKKKNSLDVEKTYEEVVASTRKGMSQLDISTKNPLTVEHNHKEVIGSARGEKGILQHEESRKNTLDVGKKKEVVASTGKGMSQLDVSAKDTPDLEQHTTKVVESTTEENVILQQEEFRKNTVDVGKTYNEVVASTRKGMLQLDASTKNTPAMEQNCTKLVRTSTKEENAILQLEEPRKDILDLDKTQKEVAATNRKGMAQLDASTMNTVGGEENRTEIVGSAREEKGTLQLEDSRKNTLDLGVDKTCKEVVAITKAETFIDQLDKSTKIAQLEVVNRRTSESALELKDTNQTTSDISKLSKSLQDTPHSNVRRPEVIHISSREGTSQMIEFLKKPSLMEDTCKEDVRGRSREVMTETTKNSLSADIPKIGVTKTIPKLNECCKQIPPVDKPVVNVQTISNELHLKPQSTNSLTSDTIHREMFRSRDPRLPPEHHSTEPTEREQNCRFKSSRSGKMPMPEQNVTNKPTAIHQDELNHSWHAFPNTNPQLGGPSYFNKTAPDFNEHFDRRDNLACVQDTSNNRTSGMLNTRLNQMVLPLSYHNRQEHVPTLNEWQNVPQMNQRIYGEAQTTSYGNNQRQIIKMGNEVALQRNMKEQNQNHTFLERYSHAMNQQTSHINSPGSIPMSNLNFEAKVVSTASDQLVMRTNQDTSFIGTAPTSHYTSMGQPFNSTGNYLHSQGHMVQKHYLTHGSEGTHHSVRHQTQEQHNVAEQNTLMKYALPDTIRESSGRQAPMLPTQTGPIFSMPSGVTKSNQHHSITSQLPNPNHSGFRGFLHAEEPNVGSAAVTAHVRRYASSQISPIAANSPDKEAAYPMERLVCRCSNCNKEAQFLCSACQSQSYCSQTCQILMWDHHARECQRLRQLLLQ